jgi:hypothetical protein
VFDNHSGYVYAVKIEDGEGGSYVPANDKDDAIRAAGFYNAIPGAKVTAVRRLISEWEDADQPEARVVTRDSDEPPHENPYADSTDYVWRYSEGVSGWQYESRLYGVPTMFPTGGFAWAELQHPHNREEASFPWRLREDN